jgi:hypothetical protein
MLVTFWSISYFSSYFFILIFNVTLADYDERYEMLQKVDKRGWFILYNGEENTGWREEQLMEELKDYEKNNAIIYLKVISE